MVRKLGISYIAFEGEELLKYALQSIREEVDFVSVIYQDVSFFGNPASQELVPTLENLQKLGLIDKLVFYKQDLSLHNKTNELNIRNLGLKLSIEAGCSHHISADVDEMYTPEHLQYAKKQIGNHDCLIVGLINYYKRPTWQIYKNQGHKVSLIHPVDVYYDMNVKLPCFMEPTRKPHRFNNLKFIHLEDFSIHHMTYVRKDVRSKLENSPAGRMCNIDEFINNFNKYELGNRLCLSPEYLNRKTISVPNIFNIGEHIWEQPVQQEKAQETQGKQLPMHYPLRH